MSISKPRLSWRDAILLYTKPRIVAVMLLGFSAGLPFLLVFTTLSGWLRDVGVSRSAIGFFSWVGITYSIKFVWAPIIDRMQVPWLTLALGRRRCWILLGQCGVLLGLIGMSQLNPQYELMLIAICALLVAFSSATQDISIDAYRIEAIEVDYQGAMAAAYVLGYRLALLVAGAGAFYIADYASWRHAYIAMALLMLVGIITTLLIKEPINKSSINSWIKETRVKNFLRNSHHLPNKVRKSWAWFIGAIVCPFTDFFQRNGKLSILILLFIGVYKISDITMGVMANPLYIDLGYSKSDIASVGKVFGFFMTIAGALFGGVLVARYSVLRPLLLGAILVAVTNLAFVWLAQQSAELLWLAIVISVDNFSGGIATAAFVAYLSSLTNTAYTATQYALFSSLMTLPAKLLGGFSGIIVDAQGYVFFFSYAAALGLPAILLVFLFMRLDRQRV